MSNDSERVILEQIKSLKEHIENEFRHNKEAHSAVLTQVTKTNGRVSSLEKWKYTMVGAISILTAVVSLIGLKISVSF
jgi:hypothetical protein